MASQRSTAYPYQWANGSWHSKPQQTGPVKGATPLQQGAVPTTDQTTGVTSYNQIPTPQPPDPSLDAARLSANRNNALATSEGAYQTGNLNFDYGYTPAGGVDTSNPYSRAALLQLGHENQARGTTNGMAAAGQLYSGAIQNQRGIDDTNYAQADAANRLAYQRGLHSIQAGQLNTYANNSLSTTGGDFDSLLKSVYGS
jgi:hypothetical protein